MALSSSLFETVVSEPARYRFSSRLAHSIAPGEFFHLANGERVRVVGKTSSAEGYRFRLVRKSGTSLVTFKQLAALHPVSPAVHRIASFVRQVLAFDQGLEAYVTGAIEQAGLPLDPTMNWGTWLTSVYYHKLRTFTQDTTLIEDAVREVLVNLLFERRVLEKRFNPDHPSLEGKELAHKVSAFLSHILKLAVPDAIDFVKKSLGIGSDGELGRKPADSLYVEDDSEEGYTYDRPDVTGVGSGEDERLGDNELSQFLESFRTFVNEGQRVNTARALNFVTDRVEEGYTRKEIRDDLVASELRSRDGAPYNVETFKLLIKNWAKLIRDFTASDSNQFKGTGLAKAILERSKDLVSDKKVSAAVLVLAQDDTGVLPHTPYSSNTSATTVIDEPSAKANPNVQQQNNSLNNKQQPSAPQSAPGQTTPQQTGETTEDDMTTPQQPPKRTIPPEIPGTNHV